MNTTAQMELTLNRSRSRTRNSRLKEDASWWFRQMRLAVEGAPIQTYRRRSVRTERQPDRELMAA